MAADLGKAYVQIMPSAKGIGNNIKTAAYDGNVKAIFL